ncbi:MAG: ribosomal RNA small subunit methyltransferase A [Clostridia bacterium]|nr:ribosomal RNA small subunit methyltransferase A [Clostridia bacterium]
MNKKRQFVGKGMNRPPQKKNDFHHKHSLGQNFLEDEALVATFVDSTGVGAEDHILEVGPGAGIMTNILAQRCKSVTAVEIDDTLLPFLRIKLEKYDNVQIEQGDIMRVNLPEIMADKGAFHVVANIPCYLTTDLMHMLLTSRLPIKSINVMVQKEAAQRLVGAPSTVEYGPLAVRAQYHTKPVIAHIVPAACFNPPPKVDSAFVCMPWREEPAVQVKDETLFFKVVNAAFAMRRKTLTNNLMNAFRLEREAAIAWIERAGLDAGVRGEALGLQAFADLANAFEEGTVLS